MTRCTKMRKRLSDARSLRTAVRAMWQDRFSPQEIAIGLRCELSEVLEILKHQTNGSAQMREVFGEVKVIYVEEGDVKLGEKPE